MRRATGSVRWLRSCGWLASAMCLAAWSGRAAMESPPDPTSSSTADLEVVVKDVDVRADPVNLGLPESGDVAWLGVSTEEAPDLLTSQMKLEPGVGLVVTFVADESPADKAGLMKNDLLVQFNDQLLVHPAQLQKLVQSRKAGESAELTYYRNGERQAIKATLGSSPQWSPGDPNAWQEPLRGLGQQFKEMHMGEAWQRQMREWERSMEHLQGEQGRIQEQVRRAVEQAQRAAGDPKVQEQIQRAIEQSMKAVEQGMRAAQHHPFLQPGRTGQFAPKVTVRSSAESAQSLVHADGSGTYVLVRNPRLRLTVHDAKGTLLFDGEIETEQQQAEVPAEIWEKVEPLVDRLKGD